MGAAGDMIMASLLSIYEDKQGFLDKMNTLIDNVTVQSRTILSGGISGTHVDVIIGGVSEGGEGTANIVPTKFAIEIDYIIDGLDLPKAVKDHALAIFKILYEAESTVHAEKLSNVHLHEVGSLDAITDIVGSAYLMYLLGAESATVSAINVGEGTVKTSHGILSVPAPATAKILEGKPIYSSGIKTELCTPTGAAILSHYGTAFGVSMPLMQDYKVGYGMGMKELSRMNAIRAFYYEDGENESDFVHDEVVVISANIDDMSAEGLSYAVEVLIKNGALDVYQTPIYMKKNRAATMISCICRESDLLKFSSLMLTHTTTLGVRIEEMDRVILNRHEETLNTPYGPVRYKTSYSSGISKKKYEFDDLKRIAESEGWSIEEVRRKIQEISHGI
jgi:uncharacterized protein (TIGR00299 family) protein